MITFIFKSTFAVPEFTQFYLNVSNIGVRNEGQCSKELIKHGSQSRIKVRAQLVVPASEQDNYDLSKVCKLLTCKIKKSPF